ncbi:microtubule-associated protein Jupiter isoform X2 [Cephus cinctus]|uniref:Microtubule-associated protein Jupiter n=1 Tax=Cephus cinctus TaxID=211228 RepID=A0AAJ7FG81_CEPCN|nr:microtubule-associated protein Jupiter isoform X2 [Cephus cinctus]
MATYAAYRHVELDNVGYGKKRVLKPPGGGSSDIFGAAPEETSPRRVKNHNQSQLGSTIFGENNSGSNNCSDTPRGNKPGNDSYKRLFGPPDAPPTPNSKNHMRSNISLCGESSAISSPARSIDSNGTRHNGNAPSNGINANFIDNTGGSSCMPRNPVTGDGVDVTPVRRSARKCRDGNPVTGTGYSPDSQNNGTPVQNGHANANANTNGVEKSSNETSPGAGGGRMQGRNRVPPGGYSSGLW